MCSFHTKHTHHNSSLLKGVSKQSIEFMESFRKMKILVPVALEILD